jgi:peptide-methionine (S)-S-oxide reductase
VSGYAGGTTANPTYRNHASGGHLEVVLVEYDPTKTSYGVLLQYAWRNIDPFDGKGQFCDKGPSDRPAIFYDGDAEKLEAQRVLGDVLAANPSWDESTLAVPLMERPVFWKAEEYHQNFYIKKPGDYGYYKQACGRTYRLKAVWGEDVYKCYHDLQSSCVDTVSNSNGTDVEAQVNVKNVPESQAALLPSVAIIIISVCAAAAAVLCVGGGLYCYCRRRKGAN